MTTIWPPTTYPTALDTFLPSLINNTDEVMAEHPNTLASAIKALEIKLGVTGDAATGFGGLSVVPVTANPGALSSPTLWVDSTSGPNMLLKYTDELGVTGAIATGDVTSSTDGYSLERKPVKASLGTAFPYASTYDTGSNSIIADDDGELNGRGGLDGLTDWAVGDRILYYTGYTSSSYLGIFEVSDLGSPTTPFVLSRPVDFDGSLNVTSGCYAYIKGGTLEGHTYELTTMDPIELGITNQTWDQKHYQIIDNHTIKVWSSPYYSTIDRRRMLADNLSATYSYAKTMEPDGNPLSLNNRVLVKIPAGVYGYAYTDFPLTLDNSFVDIEGEGIARWEGVGEDRVPSGDISEYTVPYTLITRNTNATSALYVSADGMSVKGLHLENTGLVTAGTVVEGLTANGTTDYFPPLTKDGSARYEDIIISTPSGYNNGLPLDTTYLTDASTYVNVHGIGKRFIKQSSGTFTKCTAGNLSFGWGDVEYAGKHFNCHASESFGGDQGALGTLACCSAESVFMRCVSDIRCFGVISFYGRAEDCRVIGADSASFGGHYTGDTVAILKRCFIEDMGFPLGNRNGGTNGFLGLIEDCDFRSLDTSINMMYTAGATGTEEEYGDTPFLCIRRTAFSHEPANNNVHTINRGGLVSDFLKVTDCKLPGGIHYQLENNVPNPETNIMPPHGACSKVLSVANGSTTDDTETVIGDMIAGRNMSASEYSSYVISAFCTARCGAGDSSDGTKAWKFELLITRDNGNLAIVGTRTKSILAETTVDHEGDWDAEIGVNGVEVELKSTGHVGDTDIGWQWKMEAVRIEKETIPPS